MNASTAEERASDSLHTLRRSSLIDVSAERSKRGTYLRAGESAASRSELAHAVAGAGDAVQHCVVIDMRVLARAAVLVGLQATADGFCIEGLYGRATRSA